MTIKFSHRRHALALAAVLACTLTGVSLARAADDDLARYKKAEEIAKVHIAKFDRLDFDAFTNQKWDLFKESHSANIDVYWPDGHVTHGLERHIADLKAMFVYAPDTRIHEHPVKIANGEWTSVIGVMEGTFTKPMPIGEGKTIPPTGKAFKLTMCTVGHWTKSGTMDKEFLFWDNQSYMAQIGLGK
jgi:SnoaL-like polyketide cyclase